MTLKELIDKVHEYAEGRQLYCSVRFEITRYRDGQLRPQYDVYADKHSWTDKYHAPEDAWQAFVQMLEGTTTQESLDVLAKVDV